MSILTCRPVLSFDGFNRVANVDDLLVARDPSTFLAEPLDALLTLDKRNQLEHRFISIQNAKIVVDQGILYLDDDNGYYPSFYSKAWQYKSFRPDESDTINLDTSSYRAEKLEGTWVGLASSVMFGNIFHTLIDNYARLNTVPAHWLSADVNFALGFDNDRSGNTHMLNNMFLGEGGSRLLTRGIYEVERLVLPPLAVSEDYMSIDALSFVNRRLLAAVRNPSPKHRQRLFVSRADAQTRKLLNEDAVKEALRKRGFMTLCPGEFKLMTQLELFASAEIITGVHGMGLTSIFIAGPETKALLEFEAYGWQFTSYATIANSLGIPYGTLPCTITEYDMGGMYDWRAEADVPAALEIIDSFL